MTDSRTPTAEDRSLATELVEAFAAGHQTEPTLPPGRREGVVRLLTGLMTDHVRLDAYTKNLTFELERSGVRLPLLRRPGLDLPGDQIAREGFAGLSDDQLADIALSPEAICALRQYLDEPETDPGDWFMEGILAAESARPEAPEREKRAREIYEGLLAAGLLGGGRQDTIPFARDGAMPPERGGHSGWVRPLLRYGGVAAAALLFVSLAVWAFRLPIGVKRGIRQQEIAAWTTEATREGITANNEREGASDSFIKAHDERLNPLNSSPSIHAPLTIQEQFVVPEIPLERLTGPTGTLVRKVLVKIPEGSLFRITFSTLNIPSEGSGVIIRLAPDGWRPLWGEMRVSPESKENFFGVLKMPSQATDYLLLTADLADTTLLDTVVRNLPSPPVGADRIDQWTPKLAAALEKAGHRWFGLQLIHAEVLTPEEAEKTQKAVEQQQNR